MKFKNIIYEYKYTIIEKKKQLSYLFFSTHEARNEWNKHPDIIGIDATYKLKSYFK